mgnify:CR=1 FL=1
MLFEPFIETVAEVIGTADLGLAGGFISAVFLVGILIAVAAATPKNPTTPCLLSSLFGVIIFTTLGWIQVGFGVFIIAALGAAIVLVMRKTGD